MAGAGATGGKTGKGGRVWGVCAQGQRHPRWAGPGKPGPSPGSGQDREPDSGSCASDIRGRTELERNLNYARRRPAGERRTQRALSSATAAGAVGGMPKPKAKEE
uniref:uncharacterized protein KIAA0040 homolog isoform X1 n=1 Tax=Callithrix jacchus TaxID=9483 RepID=UPI00159E36C7|nr:uncharacterized protein KIAA0040 homolog isoform X1 [Callithrix jacchus]